MPRRPRAPKPPKIEWDGDPECSVCLPGFTGRLSYLRVQEIAAGRGVRDIRQQCREIVRMVETGLPGLASEEKAS